MQRPNNVNAAASPPRGVQDWQGPKRFRGGLMVMLQQHQSPACDHLLPTASRSSIHRAGTPGGWSYTLQGTGRLRQFQDATRQPSRSVQATRSAVVQLVAASRRDGPMRGRFGVTRNRTRRRRAAGHAACPKGSGVRATAGYFPVRSLSVYFPVRFLSVYFPKNTNFTKL